ncbi:MAG: CDP-alcohol phosphatidyltransferase family protein [Calditrichaeota bacterium]|nr:MAG: CDP-alcohol phosphatidyltransferase family protein [Calditrichota bacterium]
MLEKAQVAIRNKFQRLTEPFVRSLAALHINPNLLTLLSLILCFFSAFRFAVGDLRSGALWLIIGGFIDAIDGSVARAGNRVTRFGALFDSTLDRYAEFAVFSGIAFYFITHAQGNAQFQIWAFFTVFAALAGSLMVSYVRARAEGLDFECRVGLMQRPERFILLSIGSAISEIALIVSVILIAVLANYTAIERIHYIWKIDRQRRLDAEANRLIDESGNRVNVKSQQ